MLVHEHLYASIIAAPKGGRRNRSHGKRCPRACLAALLLALVSGFWHPAAAQVGGEALPDVPPEWTRELPAIDEGWATLVDAEVLAGHLDLLLSGSNGILTLRSPSGILTLFADSHEVLWQPFDGTGTSEESLSAAVRKREDGWWLPVDVLGYLGLWQRDGLVEGPDNLLLRLTFPPPPPVMGQGGELVDLGSGLPGLRLYAVGASGPTDRSLLLADAGLLSLAMPQQRQAFDELVARSGSDKPLLLFITGLTSGPWVTEIEFSQGSSAVVARFPFRLRLLEGEASTVGPHSPVVGVVLLPAEFNLREPINVRWGGASATITFRH